MVSFIDLQIKEEALRARIWKVAVSAGGIGAIPVPGLDILINSGIMIGEIQNFVCVLELALDDLPIYFNIVSTDASVIMAMKDFLLQLLGGTGLKGTTAICASVVDDVVKAIPGIGTIVGSAVGAVTSFVVTYHALHKALDVCMSVASKKLEMIEKEAEQID